MRRDARKEALRMLNRMLEPAAVREFLKTRQSDLSDQTGQEALDEDPNGLLARLRELEELREANG